MGLASNTATAAAAPLLFVPLVLLSVLLLPRSIGTVRIAGAVAITMSTEGGGGELLLAPYTWYDGVADARRHGCHHHRDQHHRHNMEFSSGSALHS